MCKRKPLGLTKSNAGHKINALALPRNLKLVMVSYCGFEHGARLFRAGWTKEVRFLHRCSPNSRSVWCLVYIKAQTIAFYQNSFSCNLWFSDTLISYDRGFSLDKQYAFRVQFCRVCMTTFWLRLLCLCGIRHVISFNQSGFSIQLPLSEKTRHDQETEVGLLPSSFSQYKSYQKRLATMIFAEAGACFPRALSAVTQKHFLSTLWSRLKYLDPLLVYEMLRTLCK